MKLVELPIGAYFICATDVHKEQGAQEYHLVEEIRVEVFRHGTLGGSPWYRDLKGDTPVIRIKS